MVTLLQPLTPIMATPPHPPPLWDHGHPLPPVTFCPCPLSGSRTPPRSRHGR